MTTELKILARPIHKGLAGLGVSLKWIPAIYRNGRWLIDLPEGVEVYVAIEAAAIAERALNSGKQIHEIVHKGTDDVIVDLAREIAREAS